MASTAVLLISIRTKIWAREPTMQTSVNQFFIRKGAVRGIENLLGPSQPGEEVVA